MFQDFPVNNKRARAVVLYIFIGAQTDQTVQLARNTYPILRGSGILLSFTQDGADFCIHLELNTEKVDRCVDII